MAQMMMPRARTVTTKAITRRLGRHSGMKETNSGVEVTSRGSDRPLSGTTSRRGMGRGVSPSSLCHHSVTNPGYSQAPPWNCPFPIWWGSLCVDARPTSTPVGKQPPQPQPRRRRRRRCLHRLDRLHPSSKPPPTPPQRTRRRSQPPQRCIVPDSSGGEISWARVRSASHPDPASVQILQRLQRLRPDLLRWAASATSPSEEVPLGKGGSPARSSHHVQGSRSPSKDRPVVLGSGYEKP